MNNTIIELKDVDFSYINKKIYSNLNLSIDKECITYIMGNNGCGKTTLLKIISRLLSIQKGNIFINGNDISKYSNMELAKQISYVPQSINLNIDFKVVDYLAFGRTPYLKFGAMPTEKDYEIVNKYANEMNITDLLDTNFNELSGGQKQLVVITRALIQETPILIMDEPMSALDIGKQAELLLIINKLKENGKTIILTSHNPNHALQFDCNCCLINNFEIVSYGFNIDVLTEDNIKTVYGDKVKVDLNNKNVLFNLK